MKNKLKTKLWLIPIVCVMVAACADEAVAGGTDDREPVILKVPSGVRKYKLRIGGKNYSPRDATLAVEPYGRGKKMYVELLDGDNRTVYQGFRTYDENALNGMSRRSFSVDAKLGFGYIRNTNLNRIYTDTGLGFQTISAQWQPSILGLGISSGSFISHSCYSLGPCGRFKFSVTGAGVNLETAPFTGGAPFFQRLHLALNLGLSSVKTSYEVKERDVSVRDKDSSVGKYGQFEFRIPVVAKVWIDIQHGYQEIPVDLKTLNYKATLYQITHALGVRYAF